MFSSLFDVLQQFYHSEMSLHQRIELGIRNLWINWKNTICIGFVHKITKFSDFGVDNFFLKGRGLKTVCAGATNLVSKVARYLKEKSPETSRRELFALRIYRVKRRGGADSAPPPPPGLLGLNIWKCFRKSQNREKNIFQIRLMCITLSKGTNIHCHRIAWGYTCRQLSDWNQRCRGWIVMAMRNVDDWGINHRSHTCLIPSRFCVWLWQDCWLTWNYDMCNFKVL